MMIRLYPVLILLAVGYAFVSLIPLTNVYAEPDSVSLINRFAGIIATTGLLAAYLGYSALEFRYSLLTRGYGESFLKLNRAERPAFYLSIGYNILLGIMFNLMAAPRLAMQAQGIAW